MWIVGVVFGIVFLVVILTITLGEKYFESQKKRKVTEMLQTGADRPQVETKVLLEADQGESAFVKFLSRFDFIQKIENDLAQSGLNTTLNTLIVQMFVLMIPGVLIGSRFSFVGNVWLSSLLGGVIAAVLPYAYVRSCRAKRLRQFEEQFPEALEFLARAMRAGHAFSIALEMLSEESAPPLGQEFKKVFNEHNLGLPIETALANLARRVPLIDVSFFVSAVLLQRETGGNLAEILTKLAMVIRERFKLKGQVKAASAHGRITGTILTLMPVALMLGLLVVSPGYLEGMAKDPTGKWLIGYCVVGILLGHFTIRKIVKIKV